MWAQIIQQTGIRVEALEDEDTLEVWWSANRTRVRKEWRRDFDEMVLLVYWQLWKNRNAWVFGNIRQRFSPEEMVRRIFMEFVSWTRCRRGVSGVFIYVARELP